ncbi:MAG: hypoxanthine phosphoribosyltransferase [Clostridia bacterium]|nr:hypoxanthine phosphoribosyltransferase [Clostridia bacterium]
MNKDIQEILFDEEQLRQMTQTVARQINADYSGQSLVVIGVLKGSFLFLADLFRQLTADCRIDFIAASSYGASTTSSGNVRIIKDIHMDVSNKHVLLVEDILDTGSTLSYLTEYISQKGAQTVRICTLLDKPSRRTKPVQADYAGAVIPDYFVVGYGLDYDERYRNLPYIGILKPEIYTK